MDFNGILRSELAPVQKIRTGCHLPNSLQGSVGAQADSAPLKWIAEARGQRIERVQVYSEIVSLLKLFEGTV
jgi:hypothetical protein